MHLQTGARAIARALAAAAARLSTALRARKSAISRPHDHGATDQVKASADVDPAYPLGTYCPWPYQSDAPMYPDLPANRVHTAAVGLIEDKIRSRPQVRPPQAREASTVPPMRSSRLQATGNNGATEPRFTSSDQPMQLHAPRAIDSKGRYSTELIERARKVMGPKALALAIRAGVLEQEVAYYESPLRRGKPSNSAHSSSPEGAPPRVDFQTEGDAYREVADFARDGGRFGSLSSYEDLGEEGRP